MKYLTLRQEEKDDCLVGFLKGQELDHYLHQVNMERYEKIANDPEVEVIDKEFQERMKTSAKEEHKAMKTVEKIIEHTLEQLPNERKIKQSLKRLLNISKK